MKFLMTFAVIMLVASVVFTIWRTIVETRINRHWNHLATSTDTVENRHLYSPDMVADLPPNVQRFFNFVIEPGAEVRSAVLISMDGQLGLGPKENPGYKPMTARQIHRFPVGFVWSVKTGRPPLSVHGSDGIFREQSWSRFWISSLFPVVKATGERTEMSDHYKSAFGRFVCETFVFTPTALLGSPYVIWEDISDDQIKAMVSYEGLNQTVEITLDERGAPIRILFPRWSDANDQNRYQEQRFGGYLSNHKAFGRIKIPTHMEAGNFFGEEAYFPFYIADVTDLIFID